MYGNKYYFIAILFFSCIAIFGFQCKKNIDCRGNVYNFEIGIEARPDKDSINIGDTIWLTIDEPTTLKDVQTGRIVEYSNAANLGSAIGFHKLSATNQFTLGAAEQFNFKVVFGTEINNADATYLREYSFAQINNHYLFKLGVIPKQTGTFRLFFSNASSVYRKNDKCTKANFTLNFKQTDQHYYLSPTYQGGNLVGGDYYFKVY